MSTSVPVSSLIDITPFILRRRLILSSQYPLENIISDPTKGTQTRSSLKTLCAFFAFVSILEPKDVKDSIKEPEWFNAMQSALYVFKRTKYGI